MSKQPAVDSHSRWRHCLFGCYGKLIASPTPVSGRLQGQVYCTTIQCVANLVLGIASFAVASVYCLIQILFSCLSSTGNVHPKRIKTFLFDPHLHSPLYCASSSSVIPSRTASIRRWQWWVLFVCFTLVFALYWQFVDAFHETFIFLGSKFVTPSTLNVYVLIFFGCLCPPFPWKSMSSSSLFTSCSFSYVFLFQHFPSSFLLSRADQVKCTVFHIIVFITEESSDAESDGDDVANTFRLAPTKVKCALTQTQPEASPGLSHTWETMCSWQRRSSQMKKFDCVVWSKRWDMHRRS